MTESERIRRADGEEIARLRDTLAEARTDANDADTARARLADLLDRINVALRGPPEPGVLRPWGDLPAVTAKAAAVVAAAADVTGWWRAMCESCDIGLHSSARCECAEIRKQQRAANDRLLLAVAAWREP